MTQPHPDEIARAKLRQELSERFRAEFEADRFLAERAFGDGWKPRGKHCLIDHDEMDRCRLSGEKPQIAAVVVTCTKDGATKNFTVVDGNPVACLDMEDGFGPMLSEPHPTRRFTLHGQEVAPRRYGVYWSGYEPDYKPRSAESLMTARVKRQAKVVEREATGSLFADAIREEGYLGKNRER